MLDCATEWENAQYEFSNEIIQAPMMHVERLGRPRLSVNESDVSGLQRLGFSWLDFSNMIGVSPKTLLRRRT